MVWSLNNAKVYLQNYQIKFGKMKHRFCQTRVIGWRELSCIIGNYRALSGIIVHYRESKYL